MRRLVLIALATLALSALAGCGDDDGGSTTQATPGDTADGAATDTGSGDGDQDSPFQPGEDAPEPTAGAGGGTLMLGDEEITLDRSRCYLQEQDSATGGTLELSVQANGTNAAGEPVLVDITRQADDTGSPGDLFVVDVGEPGDSVSYNALLDYGTVSVDGGVSASDVVLESLELHEQVTVSVQFSC